jgi:hypothetical protein
MALICTHITTLIAQQITTPTNTWVSQQQQQCGRHHWWDPRTWFCWFITILVQIVVFVITTILVPTITVVCTIVTFVVGWFVMIAAIAIDAFCQTCNAVAWTNHWFLTRGSITFVSVAPSTTTPGSSDYTFTCHCSSGKDSTIVVTATNDDDAASQAKLECGKAC